MPGGLLWRSAVLAPQSTRCCLTLSQPLRQKYFRKLFPLVLEEDTYNDEYVTDGYVFLSRDHMLQESLDASIGGGINRSGCVD